MDPRYRHKHLLRLLAEHGAAPISRLAGWLGVSAATVRRDIRLLDTAGQLRRTHGGARRVDAGTPQPALTPGAPGSSFTDTARANAGSKRAIARRAAALCADGDTLLIGGGTTTFQLAAFLAGRPMRILTNSFAIARELLASGSDDVIITGGKVYPAQGIILSPFDTEAVQYCYADRLFMGAHCLSALGAMEADALLIQAGRRLIHQARDVVVLADASKFDRRGGMFLCALDRIARVITDTAAPDAGVQMLERAGVQVDIVAPEMPPGPRDAACLQAAARSWNSASPPH
ncbi:DeoR/GlpR family DNA-binding transcription regulator [Pseudoduganella sp. SL102]|uniref:DeoR/GlpR family DNA-binding transcription regulator n=1 Tax=Pseudoduganella sp. SL102 TaxID=2995154 RepID=UPI00248C6D62|nr:DeoR/GlpR family DNA-binding transcription regulator [Pseudoduganella sp. SL102]WBS05563.1 DeoR/GlpR family DNA-binding transcription regulator [Pseudoduganella sp. SL102]